MALTEAQKGLTGFPQGLVVLLKECAGHWLALYPNLVRTHI
jgi:hypothetical protein